MGCKQVLLIFGILVLLPFYLLITAMFWQIGKLYGYSAYLHASLKRRNGHEDEGEEA